MLRKRIGAFAMIEALVIVILIFIGCNAIINITNYCKQQLSNSVAVDSDVEFVLKNVENCGDFLYDYPPSMEVEILKSSLSYKVRYNEKVYVVSNELGRWRIARLS